MSDKKSLLGCVKWFNNKVGYGFITLSDGITEQDIFVHHSALNTTDEQYKYLVQGEYVCFELVKSTEIDSKHEYFAGNVSGVNGGKLMCETRNQTKVNPTPLPKKKYSRPHSSRVASDDYRPRERESYRERDDRDYDYRPSRRSGSRHS
jgi:cold shock CspA family protein